MLYILFSIIIFILAIIEFISSYGKIKYENHRRWAIRAFKIGKFLHRWDFNISRIQLPKSNSILFLCNHVNFIDIFIVNYILAIIYPKHHVVYITREEFAVIPIIGTYLKENHILVKNNFVEDKIRIENQLAELKRKHEKLIIVLFPEGCLYTKYNSLKSKKWCEKNNLPDYKNVLAPRINGVYTVLNAFKPEQVIQAVLLYPDNPEKTKGAEYYHFIYDYFPRKCHIQLKDVSNIKPFYYSNNFNTNFYNYWKTYVDY